MPAYNACAVAARGTNAPAFAGIDHKVVVSAVITPGTRKAVRKDAAFEVLAKGLAHVGARCVVVSLAVELACAGQFKPGLEVFGYCLIEKSSLWVARVVVNPARD